MPAGLGTWLFVYRSSGLHMCEKISVSNKMSGSEIKIEHALSNCSFLGVSLSSGV